jgi:hypothetical protein
MEALQQTKRQDSDVIVIFEKVGLRGFRSDYRTQPILNDGGT